MATSNGYDSISTSEEDEPSTSFDTTRMTSMSMPSTIDAALHSARDMIMSSIDAMRALCISEARSTISAANAIGDSNENISIADDNSATSTPRQQRQDSAVPAVLDHITLLNSLKTLTTNGALRDALGSDAQSTLSNKFEDAINAITEFELISSAVADNACGDDFCGLPCDVLAQRLSRLTALMKFREQNGVAHVELRRRRDELQGEASACMDNILVKFKEAFQLRKDIAQDAVSHLHSPPPPSRHSPRQQQTAGGNVPAVTTAVSDPGGVTLHWGDEDAGMEDRVSSSNSGGGRLVAVINRCISDAITLSTAIGAPPKASQSVFTMFKTIEHVAKKMSDNIARILSHRSRSTNHLVAVTPTDLASVPVCISYLSDLNAMLAVNTSTASGIASSNGHVENGGDVDFTKGEDGLILPTNAHTTSTSLLDTFSKFHVRVSKLYEYTQKMVSEFLSTVVDVELYDTATKSRTTGWVEAYHSGSIITAVLAPDFEEAALIKKTLDDQLRLCVSDINATVSDFKTQNAKNNCNSLLRLMTGELPAMIRLGGSLGRYAAHITRQCDSAIKALCNDATSSSPSSSDTPNQFWELYLQLKNIQEVLHQQATEDLIYFGGGSDWSLHMNPTIILPPSVSSLTASSKTLELIDSAVEHLFNRVKGLQKEFQDLILKTSSRPYYSEEYIDGLNRAVSKLQLMDVQLQAPCVRILNTELQQWIGRLSRDGRNAADGGVSGTPHIRRTSSSSTPPTHLHYSFSSDVTPALLLDRAQPFLDAATSDVLTRHNDSILLLIASAKDALVEALADKDLDANAARELYDLLRLYYLHIDAERTYPSSDVVVRTHTTALQQTIASNYDSDNIGSLRDVITVFTNNYGLLSVNFKKTSKSLFQRFFDSVIERSRQDIKKNAFNEVNLNLQMAVMIVEEASQVATLKATLDGALQEFEASLVELRKRADKKESQHTASVLGGAGVVGALVIGAGEDDNDEGIVSAAHIKSKVSNDVDGSSSSEVEIES
jgi:hypothetical protein